MNDGNMTAVLVMALCSFGFALFFLAIALWAKRSEKPVQFWSGTKIDPQKVRDVAAYNRANAIMWKVYSVPFWIAGILSCLEPLDHLFLILAEILLIISWFPGAFVLIFAYIRLEKRYILR